jgi:SAM-dependent methyltransferase
MPEPQPYTHGHHDAVLRSHRWRTVANSAAYLGAELHPGRSLLDVGCGPGTLTVDLARHLGDGHVVGIEPVAADVLAEARVAASEEGVANVHFEIGDIYHLGHSDASFDIVHAHQVLQHLPDPVGALREMGRLCRRGGVVAVRDVDYASFRWWPDDARLGHWLELYETIARGDGGSPDAGRRLLAWAHAAGFAEVTPTASVWCFATPEDRSWWGSMWADRIQHSAIARSALERELATADDLAAIADAWREWAAHPDGWIAMSHGEVLWRK